MTGKRIHAGRKVWLALLTALVLAASPALAEMPAGAPGADGGFLTGLAEEDMNFFVNPDAKYAQLAALVRETARKNSYNGSVVIATDGEVLLYGGPRARTTEGLPADPYTVYEIGSVTKMFTAVIVLRLMEQGKLSMDDPLTRFFPAYEAGGGITVADLLHMQSGIVDYVNDPVRFFRGDEGLPEGMFSGDGVLTDEVFLNCLYAAEPEAEPGTRFDYSNSNYHLLALIIEQVEGIPYEEAVRTMIFEPCGMTHSSSVSTGDETSVPDSDAGYNLFQKGSRGAGDIHSCMADLIAFDRALFGGRLISAESLELMKDFGTGGYGCALYPYAKRAYGHSGSISSYVTQNVVIESEDYGRVYFAACTSTAAGWYGLDTVMQAVLRQMGAHKP